MHPFGLTNQVSCVFRARNVFVYNAPQCNLKECFLFAFVKEFFEISSKKREKRKRGETSFLNLQLHALSQKYLCCEFKWTLRYNGVTHCSIVASNLSPWLYFLDVKSSFQTFKHSIALHHIQISAAIFVFASHPMQSDLNIIMYSKVKSNNTAITIVRSCET